MKSALPLLAGLLIAGAAHAQLTIPSTTSGAPATTPAPAAPQPPDPTTKEFRDCVKAAQDAMEAKKADDPAAIHACLSSEIKRHEGKLGAASGRAAKSLSASEKKRLDDANSAWRRFRDANCALFADPKGAPPANLENADCTLGMTVRRAQEIDALANAAARREAAKSAK